MPLGCRKMEGSSIIVVARGGVHSIFDQPFHLPSTRISNGKQQHVYTQQLVHMPNITLACHTVASHEDYLLEFYGAPALRWNLCALTNYLSPALIPSLPATAQGVCVCVYKNVKWLLVHAVSKSYKKKLIQCITVYLCNIALPRRMAESRGRIFHIQTRLRHSEQAHNHLWCNCQMSDVPC